MTDSPDNMTQPWLDRRRSGVLLPMNSLDAGTGALGANSARFVRFLGDAGFTVWQMLPVHPVDPHGSPYQSWSVHAGDPKLLSQEQLQAAGWLPQGFSGDADAAVAAALESFLRHPGSRDELFAFRGRHTAWIENYALYAAIRELQQRRPWWEWPGELKSREASALSSLASRHGSLVEKYIFEQYLFFKQWEELRNCAADAGILLMGDMPLYVAHDSAEVWRHPEFFHLDGNGHVKLVGGVPPDLFSATGQRWGNPCYDWERLAGDGFSWWIDRIRTELELFDLIRIDHFRGLESVWEIPAECATAEYGEWRQVPGDRLLQTVLAEAGRLPFIAEDLGLITPPVEVLRRSFGLPGMKVLQFAFDSDAKNPYLPHNHETDFVVYTGTHDNNTTVGWFETLDPKQQDRIRDYLGGPAEEMPWPLVRAALASVCRLAIIPMQDVLAQGAAGRINTPGVLEGNWRWRLHWEPVTPDLTERLLHLNRVYGRNP